MKLGEVVLIRMDYHQGPGAKVRPAVVLLDSGDEDVVAAPVTSQRRTSDFDVELRGWASAGLNVPSWVRIHKMTVLAKRDILRHLGEVSAGDRDSLLQALDRAFQA